MTYDSTFSAYGKRLRDFIRWSSANISPGDRMSAAEDEQQFNELACDLFQLQFKNNAAYRRFCETRNISPGVVTNWKQAPAVPTAAFKVLELTSLAPAERTTVFYSSGTTEHRPSRHFHNAESLAVYEASLWPWFAKHLFADAKKVGQASRLTEPKEAGSKARTGETPVLLCILTPPLAHGPHSSLIHMFETVRRQCGSDESAYTGAIRDGAWAINFDQTVLRLQQAVSANHPIAILGTAFNFVHLLDRLSERNLCYRLPEGSRVLETGGYKGRSRSLQKEQFHGLVTEFLGIPNTHIICEYGMSELSSQAYDRRVQSTAFRRSSSESASVHTTDNTQHAPRRFHFPAWARVQIISPETGREVNEDETGLIRVCDLANVRSVMAVQTEDLAVRCGGGFELIGRAAPGEPRGCSLMTAQV